MPDCSIDSFYYDGVIEIKYFYPKTKKIAFYVKSRQSYERAESSLDFPYDEIIEKHWDNIMSIKTCKERQTFVDEIIEDGRIDYEKNNDMPNCAYDESYLLKISPCSIHCYYDSKKVAFYVKGRPNEDTVDFILSTPDKIIYENYDKILSIKDCDLRQAFVDHMVEKERLCLEQQKEKDRLDREERAYETWRIENPEIARINDLYEESQKEREDVQEIRRCEKCGIDISDHPTHHTKCLDCWIEGENFNDDLEGDDYLEDESNMDSHERSCVVCGCDISDTPHYYTMCNHCYKESLNRSDDHDDTTVSSNYEDSSSDPSDGFDDEWGFYNIYGEFPDWKKKK